MKALIVDDAEFMRELLKSVIEPLDFDTIELAEDHDEAISLFEENDFDLVLLDIILGEKDGIQTLKDMKEIDETISVIIVSSIRDMAKREEAEKAGAEAYISKPFENEKVREKVKEVLGL